jgi:hypothetical protein
MMVLAVLAGLGFQVGCNDPVARRETARRRERIALWLGEAADRERIGSARVKAAFREAGRIWRQDASRTRQNDRELRELISWEQRRWQRRQPAFRAKIEKELAGKPEHVRPTAVRMFF